MLRALTQSFKHHCQRPRTSSARPGQSSPAPRLPSASRAAISLKPRQLCRKSSQSCRSRWPDWPTCRLPVRSRVGNWRRSWNKPWLIGTLLRVSRILSCSFVRAFTLTSYKFMAIDLIIHTYFVLFVELIADFTSLYWFLVRLLGGVGVQQWCSAEGEGTASTPSRGQGAATAEGGEVTLVTGSHANVQNYYFGLFLFKF